VGEKVIHHTIKQVLVRGAIVVIVPCLAARHNVSQVFGWLVAKPADDETVVAIMDSFKFLSLPFFAATTLCILWHVSAALKATEVVSPGAGASIRTRHIYTAAEIIGVMAAFPQVDLLMAFSSFSHAPHIFFNPYS
jgi:hypothetical protein